MSVARALYGMIPTKPTHTAIALGALVLGCLTPGIVDAQTASPRFMMPTRDADVSVTRDVQYALTDSGRLAMDVYRPTATGAARRPTIVFFNRATGANRSSPFHAGWARAAAARGLVAILPDLRNGTEAQDFARLAAHLAERGATYGIDSGAIAIYAGSGNVWTALPMVQDPAQVRVKAAVMYYGAAQVEEFRGDIPLLFVRAGLDRPGVNQAIVALADRAIARNAPVTMINHPGGRHGFEQHDDDAATRDAMERTLDWVKRVLAPDYLAAMRRGLPEATAAGFALSGKTGQAAATYADLVRERPDDASLRLSYGEALLADGQHASACAEFGKLMDKGLGARDLGLPAARACLASGDADTAIAWLKSIPARFLPASVQQEPAFASLRDRADFKALFAAR